MFMNTSTGSKNGDAQNVWPLVSYGANYNGAPFPTRIRTSLGKEPTPFRLTRGFDQINAGRAAPDRA